MNAVINVMDTVSFETSDGLDILTGVCWAIEEYTIVFLALGQFYSVPRRLAELSTVLIKRFEGNS